MTSTQIGPLAAPVRGRARRLPLLRLLAITSLVCAIAIRLPFAWPALTGGRDLDGDEADYYGRAIALLHDGSFSVDGQPTARRLPAFPVLLVPVYAVDSRPLAAIPLTLALSIATCGGIYLLGRQLFDRRVGLTAALLSAFDLNLAWPAGHLLSEALYVPLALLAFLGLVEARRRRSLRWLGGAGALCGLALLTRVQFLPLVPVVAGWTLLAWSGRRRQAILAAVVVAVTIGAVWAPWGVRNAILFGRVMPTTSQPCPPCVGLYHDGALDLSQPKTFAQWQLTTSSPGLDELAASRYRLDQARGWILEHPVEAALIALLQAPMLWRPTGLGLGSDLLTPIAWLGFLALLLGSGRGLAIAWRSGRGDLSLWAGAAVALTLFAVVTIGDPRHRLVLHPILNVLTAVAVVDLVRRRWRLTPDETRPVPNAPLAIDGRRPPALESPPADATTDWPVVDVVVPVHDEAAWIDDKLRDVVGLDYPADRLRIWIVDGASTDGTAERVAAWAAADRRCHLLRLPIAHKTTQLNAALRRATGDWVLVTDADARLPRETLRRLVGLVRSDPALGAVGTYVRPARAHPLERLHWALSNRVRQWEATAGAASLVVAPCYLVRRSILPAFPGDAVADDVHVALAVSAAGWRTGLAPIGVRELRAPQRLAELFGHKVRKLEYYLRELVRFLPVAGGMPALARVVFAGRVAQLVLLPPLSLTALVVGLLLGPAPVLLGGLTIALAMMATPIARWLPAPLLLPSLALLLDAAALVALARLAVRCRAAPSGRTQPTPIRIRGEP